MTASAAISGYGTLAQISDGVASPSTGWLTIAEVYSVSAALAGTSIEVTHLLSDDAWKEFIAGQKEATVTLGMNFLTSDPSQVQLLGSLTAAAPADGDKVFRLTFQDYGTSSRTATVVSGTDVWTTGSAHGWQTGQRIKATSAGTFPTTSPATALISGGFAYVGRTGASTLKLYPTSADAIAGTSAIDFTSTGSGTHTLAAGSWWVFTGLVTGHSAEMPNNDRLSAQVTIKVTNSISFNP
jgi:predicted secreted protein